MKNILKFFLLTLCLLFSAYTYAAGVQGLTYETYAAGGTSPSIYGRTLLTSGTVSNINFSWGGGGVLDSGRADGVIVHFYGYYRVPGTGPQTLYFGIDSDDGQKLSVNGTTLVDCWCDQGSGFRTGAITLTGNTVVPIDVWFYENGGGAFVKVFWYNSSTSNWEIIPAANFATDSSYFDLNVTMVGGSDGITSPQLSTYNSAMSRLNSIGLGNRIDLEVKIGTSNPIVNIEQSGNYNLIQGQGGGNAIIDGDNNSVTIKQGSISGRNLIEFSITGNSNSVTIWQARNNETGNIKALESGGHYFGLTVVGDSNSISNKQNNDGGTNSGHFSLLDVTGNTNTINISQSNDNEKKVFSSITGSNNLINVTQQGLGNQYLDLTFTGNGHSATVIQKDSGSHKATINLINAGGPSNLTLMQQGATGQSYSIFQQCANSAGCLVNVNQQ